MHGSDERGKAGEHFVNNIATKQFLSFWCYPNAREVNGSHKEICDLLIAFGDELIIFSVKNYTFKGDYRQYFGKTVYKAVRQIQGAERKLLRSPKAIRIQHSDYATELVIPVGAAYKVHRIVVNINDGVHFYRSNERTRSGQFVHVMTGSAFEAIMLELDALPDLLDYLRKREDLLKNKRCYLLPSADAAYETNVVTQFMELASGEEGKPGIELLVNGSEKDLLASYLFNGRNFPDTYRLDGFDHGTIDCEGEWMRYIRSSEVLRKKLEDRSSYFVDELVRNEVLRHREGVPLAMELMSLGRFHRRAIGKACLSFFELHNSQSGWFYGRRYISTDHFGLLIIYYGDKFTNRPDFQTFLQFTIDAYAYKRGYVDRKIVLIAMTQNGTEFTLGLRQGIEPFPEEVEEGLEKEIQRLEWFTEEVWRPFHEKEYPEAKT